MREYVYLKRADYLPKQYVNFTGKRSMLEHTLDRAEKLIASKQLLIVISKEHLSFENVRHQLATRDRDCIITQPENKDTAAGILLPLLYLHKRDPAAVIAFFPSDHFILEEDLLMRYVERAFSVVERNPARVVLLGIEPNEADPEYGYILPRDAIDDSGLDRPVELFVEKPPAATARKIIKKGSLWNTFIFAVACQTLLRTIKLASPELYRAFEPFRDAVGTPNEQRVLQRVYRRLHSLNFWQGGARKASL